MVMISNPLYRNIAQPYQQNTQPLYGSYFGNAPVGQGLGFQLGVPKTVGGLLTMTGLPTPTQPPAPPPVLTTPTVAPTDPASDLPPVTSTNVPPRRDAVAMAVPRPAVPLSEKLMRVGGAIVGASERGGLAAFQAGTDEYGRIMDTQRQLDTLYNRDMQARIDASAEAQKKRIEGNQDIIDQYLAINDKLNEGLRGLEGKGDGSDAGITGFWDATIGKLQYQLTGDPRRDSQLLLSELKVDDTLLRVSKTKGAISNKEMDLFLEPAPTNYDDEENWKRWIRRKQKAIEVALYNLQNGIDLREQGMAAPTDQQIDEFANRFGLRATSGGVPAQVGETGDIDGVQIKRLQ